MAGAVSSQSVGTVPPPAGFGPSAGGIYGSGAIGGSMLFNDQTSTFFGGQVVPVVVPPLPPQGAAMGRTVVNINNNNNINNNMLAQSSSAAPSSSVVVAGCVRPSYQSKNANNTQLQHPHPSQSIQDRDSDAGGATGGGEGDSVVVSSNQMSASVPNLTTSQEAAHHPIEAVTPPGFLETFAAMAKRRTGQGQGIHSVIGGGGVGGGAGVGGIGGATGNANNNNSVSGTGFFPRGQNSVTSLVKLALSSNFHTGFLSTAQSYPSLSSANNTGGGGGGVGGVGGQNSNPTPANATANGGNSGN